MHCKKYISIPLHFSYYAMTNEIVSVVKFYGESLQIRPIFLS